MPTSPTQRRFLLSVAVAAAFVLVTLQVGGGREREPGIQAPGDSSMRSAPTAVDTAEGASVASAASLIERVSATRVNLHVFDVESAVPIAGACVFDSGASHDLTEAGALAISSSHGDAAWDSDCRLISVAAHGYQPAQVEIPPTQRSLRVGLQPGSRLTFDCRTNDGRPVEGVELFASTGVPLAAAAPEEVTLDFLSGGPVSRWSGRSNAGGRAELNQLGPGTVYLNATLPDTIVSITSSVEIDPGKDAEVLVLVHRLLGFRVKMPGSSIRAIRWAGHHERYAACTRWTIQQVSTQSYRQLPRRGPEAVQDAWLPSPELPGQGEELLAEFLVEGGWQSAKVLIQYLDIAREQVLTPQHLRAVPGDHVEIDADSVMGAATLVFSDEQEGVLRLLVEDGERVWLPFGRYRVVDFYGRECIRGGNWEFVETGPRVLTLGYDGAAPVDLTVEFQGGGRPNFAFVDAVWHTADGQQRTSSGQLAGGKASLLLPLDVTSVEVGVRLFGRDTWRQTIDLAEGRSHHIRLPQEILK